MTDRRDIISCMKINRLTDVFSPDWKSPLSHLMVDLHIRILMVMCVGCITEYLHWEFSLA